MLRPKSVFMLFLLSCSPVLGDEEGILLDRILPPSTLQRYRDADYPEQMKIIRRTIQNTCTRLKVQVARNEQDEYLRRLEELKTLGDEALARSRETTSKKMLTHKEVKSLEIELRYTLNLLEDLKMEVHYEIRNHFYPSVDSLDRLRKHLFLQLFEAARSFETELGNTALGFAGGSARLREASMLLPAQGLHTIDRFTEEEFRSIQTSRTLDDRIEVILEIAESRLNEIERRESGAEWDEEDPNPLEFFTYEDLLHAYNRALEAAMHSIDDDFERGISRMDEIEDSLDELNKSCREFEPRLIKMENLIREIKSLDLAKKLSQAQELTSAALKGTETGLKSIRKEE